MESVLVEDQDLVLLVGNADTEDVPGEWVQRACFNVRSQNHWLRHPVSTFPETVDCLVCLLDGVHDHESCDSGVSELGTAVVKVDSILHVGLHVRVEPVLTEHCCWVIGGNHNSSVR